MITHHLPIKMETIEREHMETFICLTRREQEIPHFYKWWDELR